MPSETTQLTIVPREAGGSRENRRLRREGRIPGVLYGGKGDCIPFSVDERELRTALRSSGAVIELSHDGTKDTAVIKDQQRHPVRHEIMHIDFVRVRMDVAIQTPVVLELINGEESPGSTEGGVLEQTTRELNIEALPGEIPESIQHDVSDLELNATVHLSDVTAPAGIVFLDDPETVVATMTLPRLEVETPDEVETETEVVGEGEGEALAAEGSDAETQPETGGADNADDAQTTSE